MIHDDMKLSYDLNFTTALLVVCSCITVMILKTCLHTVHVLVTTCCKLIKAS